MEIKEKYQRIYHSKYKIVNIYPHDDIRNFFTHIVAK